MKLMKKLKLIIPVIFLSLLFTSCIDYVQSISFKDGEYHLYYKITLSKLLCEMGDNDSEDMFDELGEETLEGLPENVTVKPVNTDLELGAEYFLSVNPRTTKEEEKALLPKISGNKCFIPFLIGSEDSSYADSLGTESSEGEAFLEAILSSAKCRIIISKVVLPQIKNAYFEGAKGNNYIIPVFDYGDSYCLEIPLVILIAHTYRTDRVVVIRKTDT